MLAVGSYDIIACVDYTYIGLLSGAAFRLVLGT